MDGVLRQTSLQEDARAVIGDPTWSNYTVTLKARRIGGNEAILIIFGLPEPNANIKSWLSLGGWENTAHGIQVPEIPERRIPGTLENGRWYDVKVELSGDTVRAWLDHALDGKDITRTSGWKQFDIPIGHPIDAEISRDDDGSYYMVWSQRFMAKMNRDFSGFDGEPIEIRTKRGGYSEGPQIIKRDGIYYYLYTLGGGAGYAYTCMMSRESVLGPWEAPEHDIIAVTDHAKGIYGPGHGYFFNPVGSDQWYFVHLEYGRSGTNGQAVATKMEFNPDGTIQSIELTLEGVGAIRQDPRYSTPNLALGRSATASSVRPEVRIHPTNELNRIETFSPENAIDGSNGSRWMAEENDLQVWYQLDLGEVKDIQRTELYFDTPTKGHAYRLEYSTDGETWQDYGGNDEVQIKSPHVDKKAVSARYLKVTLLKGAPGLWEFCVY